MESGSRLRLLAAVQATAGYKGKVQICTMVFDRVGAGRYLYL